MLFLSVNLLLLFVVCGGICQLVCYLLRNTRPAWATTPTLSLLWDLQCEVTIASSIMAFAGLLVGFGVAEGLVIGVNMIVCGFFFGDPEFEEKFWVPETNFGKKANQNSQEQSNEN